MNQKGRSGYKESDCYDRTFKVSSKGDLILPVVLCGERVSLKGRIMLVKFTWYHGRVTVGKEYALKRLKLVKEGDILRLVVQDE